jgi:L-ascorbate metabolism protein UlaG (beta-lactamase superfamily)
VGELSSAMIDQASREVLGYDLHLTEEDIRKALDPYFNVAIREVVGGPGPQSMETLISHQEEELKQRRNWLSQRRGSLDKAKEACQKAQLQIISATPKD